MGTFELCASGQNAGEVRYDPCLHATGHLANRDTKLCQAVFHTERVVVLKAFPMLCPEYASQGLPLSARLAEAFEPTTLQVIGMQTVFEHHDVQGTRAALEAFMYEYRLPFPGAIDAPGDGALPPTMTRLGLRGTPSLLVLDQVGRIRAQLFGSLDVLLLGALHGTRITEYGSQQERYMPSLNGTPPANGCGDTGCPLPGSAPPCPQLAPSQPRSCSTRRTASGSEWSAA